MLPDTENRKRFKESLPNVDKMEREYNYSIYVCYISKINEVAFKTYKLVDCMYDFYNKYFHEEVSIIDIGNVLHTISLFKDEDLTLDSDDYHILWKGNDQFIFLKNLRKIKNIIKEINCKHLLSIYPYMFKDFGELCKIVLPENTISIPDNCFENCTKLNVIEGIENVKFFGISSFHNCDELVSLDLRNAVLIKEDCFYNCKKLNSIKFESTIDSINDNAFRMCKELTCIDLRGCNLNIEENSFYGCDKLTVLVDGEFSKRLKKDYLSDKNYNCIFKTEDEQLLDFSGLAFKGKTAINLDGYIIYKAIVLKETDFMNRIKCIDMGHVKCFEDYIDSDANSIVSRNDSEETIFSTPLKQTCVIKTDFKLKEKSQYQKDLENRILKVILNNKQKDNAISFTEETKEIQRLTILPEYMFAYKQNLESVVLPPTVVIIGPSCFEGCIRLAQINLEKVQYIQKRAFYGCISLKYLQFENMIKIESESFYECTQLQYLDFEHCKYMKSIHDIINTEGINGIRFLHRNCVKMIIDSKEFGVIKYRYFVILPHYLFKHYEKCINAMNKVYDKFKPTVMKCFDFNYWQNLIDDEEIEEIRNEYCEFNLDSPVDLDIYLYYYDLLSKEVIPKELKLFKEHLTKLKKFDFPPIMFRDENETTIVDPLLFGFSRPVVLSSKTKKYN